jgi:hypothetical protein
MGKVLFVSFYYVFSRAVIDVQMDSCVLDGVLVILYQLDELVSLRLLYRHVVALLLHCLQSDVTVDDRGVTRNGAIGVGTTSLLHQTTCPTFHIYRQLGP